MAKGTVMKAILFGVLILSACDLAAPAAAPDGVEQAECMVPVRAWCESQAKCHATGFNLAACYDDGADACRSSDYRTGVDPEADPWACGELQRALACAPAGGTVNTPASAGCLESFWRWP